MKANTQVQIRIKEVHQIEERHIILVEKTSSDLLALAESLSQVGAYECLVGYLRSRLGEALVECLLLVVPMLK